MFLLFQFDTNVQNFTFEQKLYSIDLDYLFAMHVDNNTQHMIDKLLLLDQFMDEGFFTDIHVMMAHVEMVDHMVAVVSWRCDAYFIMMKQNSLNNIPKFSQFNTMDDIWNCTVLEATEKYIWFDRLRSTPSNEDFAELTEKNQKQLHQRCYILKYLNETKILCTLVSNQIYFNPPFVVLSQS